jgi:hypothetical protein
MVRQHIHVNKTQNKCYMYASLPLMKMPHWTASLNLVVPFQSWMLMQDCGMFEMGLIHIDHCCHDTYMEVFPLSLKFTRTRKNPHWIKELIDLPDTQDLNLDTPAKDKKKSDDLDALLDNSKVESLFSRNSPEQMVSDIDATTVHDFSTKTKCQTLPPKKQQKATEKSSPNSSIFLQGNHSVSIKKQKLDDVDRESTIESPDKQLDDEEMDDSSEQITSSTTP